jgi:cytochrome oxidase assembly protein ShyY1
MGPEKHLGYAVQWFAMATALVGLYLYLSFSQPRIAKRTDQKNKKKEKPHGNSDESSQHV